MTEAAAEALSAAKATTDILGARLRAAMVGRDDVIELVLIALLADGHVLLEDFPGSGKTTLARAIGEAITSTGVDVGGIALAQFRRIQFTPDLLPSDITGTTVFEPERGFQFRPGPLFAHVVLADEINRTSPKVQSAMLEAMAEKQVTADDRSYRLDDLFFVIATQNPLDLAGTYPLPSPQLDRFLFKIEMTHIAREDEIALLGHYPTPMLQRAASMASVSREAVLAARVAVRERIFVAPAVREALVDLARSIREDARVLQGVSTRSLLLALPAMQARAMIHGRDFVGPEDIERLAARIFTHRLELSPGSRASDVLGSTVGPVIEKLARTRLQQ